MKTYVLKFENNDVIFDKNSYDVTNKFVEIKDGDKVINKVKIEKDDIGLYFTELLTTK